MCFVFKFITCTVSLYLYTNSKHLLIKTTTTTKTKFLIKSGHSHKLFADDIMICSESWSR